MTSRTGAGGDSIPSSSSSAAAPWTGIWYVAAATSSAGDGCVPFPVPAAAAAGASPPAHTSSMLTLAAVPSNIISSISVAAAPAPAPPRRASIAYIDSPSDAFEAGPAAYSTPPNAAPGPDRRRLPRGASRAANSHAAGAAEHVPAGGGGGAESAPPTGGSDPARTGGATAPNAVKWCV